MRSKLKIKSLIAHIILLITAIMCTLTLNSIKVHASEIDFTSWAEALVDSASSNSSVGNQTIKHGVWYSYTGYLCYLLDTNGNAVPGTNAIAFKSPGFSYYTSQADTKHIMKSRKGGYTSNVFKIGTAPWALTPWQNTNSKNECISNEPGIRAWFEQKDENNIQNVVDFIATNWDPNYNNGITDKFGQGDYVLVIETLMHFQYSVSKETVKRTGESVYNGLIYKYTTMPDQALLGTCPCDLDAYYNGDISMSEIRTELLKSVTSLYKKYGPSYFQITETTREFIGDPVVGTIPNLIEYKKQTGRNPIVFDSFLNKAAPFAEMINSGDIGEEIGFIAWKGATDKKISNDQVLGPNNSAGLAMIVISATEKQDDIDTYSPPEGSPGNAEDPSTNPNKQGKVTIIKGYYIEDTKTGTKTSDGVYTRKDVTNIVNIMDEPNDYKLVQWDIAETVQAVDPTNWNPPSNQTGTTPQTVELKETDKVVYVLLKKTDETPKEEEQADGDWILTESRLTRIAKTTNTDTNKDLLSTHKFTVTYPSLSKTHSNCYYYCPEDGYHSWTDPETDETHGYSCDGCVGVDEDRSLSDTDIEIYWKNELKETYKDLMSHKNDEVWGEKWNKHFKGNRTSRDAQTDELTGVTYEFLIHRAGKDNTMIYNGKSGLTGNNNQVENNLLDLGFVSGKVNQFL